MNKGIFESSSQPSSVGPSSPFAVVPDEASPPKPSPFAVLGKSPSSFSGASPEEAAPSAWNDPNRPVRIPERRKAAESPFQIEGPTEGFGFEPAPAAANPSPFSQAEARPQPAANSPFSIGGNQTGQQPAPVQSVGPAPFQNWQQSAQQAPQPYPVQSQLAAQQAQVPQQVPSMFQPAQQAPAENYNPSASVHPGSQSRDVQKPVESHDGMESSSIRQLELRAIFGVDREMSADEILQRTRALPGMRNIARVQQKDMGAIDALRSLLPSLGFGSGTLKLYCGSVPLEFIREGNVLLAVQTDGGYAPGVRETLMLVARELNRIG